MARFTGHDMKELLTVTEAAKHLGEPERNVRRWVAAGLFHGGDKELAESQKLGRQWTIPAASLENFQKPKRGAPSKDWPRASCAVTGRGPARIPNPRRPPASLENVEKPRRGAPRKE